MQGERILVSTHEWFMHFVRRKTMDKCLELVWCGGMCHLRHSMGGSRCAPPQIQCTGCEFLWGGAIALPTAPPSIPRVMMPPTERFGIWGSGERLSELATSTCQGGENPCWWGHPLTKGNACPSSVRMGATWGPKVAT